MKLRIRGNSIRLRLLKSEVARLETEKKVGESIRFGPLASDTLRYTLEVSEEIDQVSAGIRDSEVFVTIPSKAAAEWIESEQVGVHATYANGGEQLEIAVEKDFACGTRTNDPDSEDAFPNPNAEEKC